MQRTGSREAFEIGKAASIAQALVAIPTTAIEAYKSLAGIPVVGPGLGAAAAAAAVAAGTANVNRIRSTKFQAFADGGLVQGGIAGQDSVPALLTPGEVVVPERDFRSINFNNDRQISLLTDIRSLLTDRPDNFVEETEPPAPIEVNLVLNDEILANQILELNRDNQRIA